MYLDSYILNSHANSQNRLFSFLYEALLDMMFKKKSVVFFFFLTLCFIDNKEEAQ